MPYHEGRRNMIILRGLGTESRAILVSSTGSLPEGLVPQDAVFKKMVFIPFPGSIWKLAY